MENEQYQRDLKIRMWRRFNTQKAAALEIGCTKEYLNTWLKSKTKLVSPEMAINIERFLES